MSQMQSINCDDVREIRPSYWNSPLDSDPAEARRTVRSVPTTRCPTANRVALYCRIEDALSSHTYALAWIALPVVAVVNSAMLSTRDRPDRRLRV